MLFRSFYFWYYFVLGLRPKLDPSFGPFCRPIKGLRWGPDRNQMRSKQACFASLAAGQQAHCTCSRRHALAFSRQWPSSPSACMHAHNSLLNQPTSLQASSHPCPQHASSLTWQTTRTRTSSSVSPQLHGPLVRDLRASPSAASHAPYGTHVTPAALAWHSP